MMVKQLSAYHRKPYLWAEIECRHTSSSSSYLRINTRQLNVGQHTTSEAPGRNADQLIATKQSGATVALANGRSVCCNRLTAGAHHGLEQRFGAGGRCIGNAWIACQDSHRRRLQNRIRDGCGGRVMSVAKIYNKMQTSENDASPFNYQPSARSIRQWCKP